GKATATIKAFGRIDCPPVLDPIPDEAFPAGRFMHLCGFGHDPDAADTLTYTLNPAISGAIFDPYSGCISWRTGEGDIGYHGPFTMRVTDGLLWDSKMFNITVTTAPPAQPETDSHNDGIVDTAYNCP